ncbi:hypothetical protein MKJ01_12450 [Chryseobacterium sp. SSA4.19]|uniref:hypothetical protein n=1 Tax=Chryseobacterium sp. SSA4.19 TaxID=2919915 RepID=UPI001F4E0088|nr:hypothetical protein [Chryseobacterium sp. SSA4.19]MCJ8154575.1 hypothetical protein [Chryseobacterium sp. SSA4.19]
MMKNISVFLFLFFYVFTFSQSKVLVNNNLNIVEDSLKRQKIIENLSQFILDKNIENENLRIINPKNKLETWLFLDELRKLQNSKIFTTQYNLMYEIISAEVSDKNNYIVYLNCYFKDKETKHSVANIQISVQEINNQHLLSSTIKNNLNNWKSKSIENYTFYFEKNIDEKKMKDFISKNNQLSLNLKEQKLPTTVYCADGILKANKLLGIDYKTDESDAGNFF